MSFIILLFGINIGSYNNYYIILFVCIIYIYIILQCHDPECIQIVANKFVFVDFRGHVTQ